MNIVLYKVLRNLTIPTIIFFTYLVEITANNNKPSVNITEKAYYEKLLKFIRKGTDLIIQRVCCEICC